MRDPVLDAFGFWILLLVFTLVMYPVASYLVTGSW